MEKVDHKGKEFKLIGVWHYSGKCVVLLDMGMCFLVKKDGATWITIKVVGPIEVPKIGKEIANLWGDYLLGKVKDTQHKVKQGWKEGGYQTGVSKGLAEILGK